MKYINIDCDQLLSIIKQISKLFETRSAFLTSSKEIFHQATPRYKQSLASYGYKEKLTYVDKNAQNQKESRKL